MALYKNPIEPKDVIKNWLSVKTNIEFLALWEQMHNPNLKGVEIEAFKSEAGTHYFTMSPQRWIKKQMLLVLFQNQVTTEEHMHTQI